MSSKVMVVDYGIGNLHSVVKALRARGADVAVSSTASEVAAAERVVLPGVGAFPDGMARLRERHLDQAIRTFVRTERPFLGICLGMQMLMSGSEEFGQHEGLDIIAGQVRAIVPEPGLKVPQIGWNRIAPPPGATWRDTVLEPLPTGAMMYFVHSFTAVPTRQEDRLADAAYGGNRISAALRRGSVTGCQFHPEKSGELGLRVIDRFLGAGQASR